MYIKIDPSNGVPLYLQIVNQVKTAIAMGRLLPENCLPSVRQLALDLAVNPNTIARAYLDLEHEGIIYKRPGQGTFVSVRGVEMSKRERLKILNELLAKSLVEGVNLGLGAEEMRSAFEQQLQKMTTARHAESVKGK
jgi:GntR family transcriptional regulator